MKRVIGLIVLVSVLGADLAMGQCVGGACSAGPLRGRAVRSRTVGRIREVKVVRKSERR